MVTRLKISAVDENFVVPGRCSIGLLGNCRPDSSLVVTDARRRHARDPGDSVCAHEVVPDQSNYHKSDNVSSGKGEIAHVFDFWTTEIGFRERKVTE